MATTTATTATPPPSSAAASTIAWSEKKPGGRNRGHAAAGDDHPQALLSSSPVEHRPKDAGNDGPLATKPKQQSNKTAMMTPPPPPLVNSLSSSSSTTCTSSRSTCTTSSTTATVYGAADPSTDTSTCRLLHLTRTTEDQSHNDNEESDSEDYSDDVNMNDDDDNDDPFTYSDDNDDGEDAYFQPTPEDEQARLSRFGNQNGYGSTIMNNNSSSQPQRSLRRPKRKKRKHKKNDHEPSSSSSSLRILRSVRGRPQEPSAKDQVWMWLFFLQLLFTLVCAARFGWTLLDVSNSSTSTTTTTPLTTTNHGSGTATTLQKKKKNNPKKNLPKRRSRFLRDSDTPTTSMSFASSSTNATMHHHHHNSSMAFASHNITTTTTNHHHLPAAPPTPADLKSLQDDDYIAPDFIPNPKSKQKNHHASTITSTTSGTSSTLNSEQEEPTKATDKGGGGGASSSSFTIDYQTVTDLFLLSGVFGSVYSYLTLGFFWIVARHLIPTMLVFSIASALTVGIFGWFFSPSGGIVPILAFGLIGWTIVYALLSWSRVSFCSTNLYTAICAMKSFGGVLLVVGMGTLCVALLWCWIWSIAFMGMINVQAQQDQQENQDGISSSSNNDNDNALVLGNEDYPHHLLWSQGRTIELVLLLFGFYWTTMVIQNVLRVTVAGAVGAWWFGVHQQEEQHWWNGPVWNGLRLSCSTWLFGSICLGSLVLLPFQCVVTIHDAFQNMIHSCGCCGSRSTTSSTNRCNMTATDRTTASSLDQILQRHEQHLPEGEDDDDHSLAFSHASSTTSLQSFSIRSEQMQSDGKRASSSVYSGTSKTTSSTHSITSALFSSGRPCTSNISIATAAAPEQSSLEWLRDSCNSFAYTYIGMYGYTFLEGGQKATQLFAARHYDSIVQDRLIHNMLLIASIVIGGATGCFAVLVEEVDGFAFAWVTQPIATAFWIGSLLGFCLASVLLLGMVGSAVNTVLVCYAADPSALERYHHHHHVRLSREMKEAWAQERSVVRWNDPLLHE